MRFRQRHVVRLPVFFYPVCLEYAHSTKKLLFSYARRMHGIINYALPKPAQISQSVSYSYLKMTHATLFAARFVFKLPFEVSIIPKDVFM